MLILEISLTAGLMLYQNPKSTAMYCLKYKGLGILKTLIVDILHLATQIDEVGI